MSVAAQERIEIAVLGRNWVVLADGSHHGEAANKASTFTLLDSTQEDFFMNQGPSEHSRSYIMSRSEYIEILQSWFGVEEF